MPQGELDVIVVGAGFAGMYSLHRMLKAGYSVRAFETGDDVGGTWYWNRYPGARCDVESMEYSYSFDDDLQQEWTWREKYAPQPEILKYANHVADRFALRPHITFNTRIVSAHFIEGKSGRTASHWVVITDSGETVSARFCIMATGCLSTINKPDFKGIDSFTGKTLHTGQWPHEGVDFSDTTVGMIGTGSSAIQSIPIIVEQAKHLTIFQRTPNFSIPAHNEQLDAAFVQELKSDYLAFRAANRTMLTGFGARRPKYDDSVQDADEQTRKARFEEKWALGGLGFLSAFGDLTSVTEANNIAAEFVRGKIHDIVEDQAVAALLSPDSVIGCKRLCVDTDYYATFNRDNVTLVDVSKAPVETITPGGLITGGREYTFDALILATGFDAMTGTLFRIDIRGRNGQTLKDKWHAGPRTYLGLATHGFPNLFTISGPGSPSVLSNMIVTIEQHVDWIADCIDYLKDNNFHTIEAGLDAEDAWVTQGNDIANETLFPRCNSWYLGANVPGKPRVFMPYIGGLPAYIEICEQVAAGGYEGFTLA